MQAEAPQRESQLVYATETVEQIVQSAERQLSKSRKQLHKIKIRNQFLEAALTCSEATNQDLRAEVAALRSQAGGSADGNVWERDNAELRGVVCVLEEANEALLQQVETLHNDCDKGGDGDHGRVDALVTKVETLQSQCDKLERDLAYCRDRHAICQQECRQLQRRLKDPSMPGMTPHPDFVERTEIDDLRQQWETEMAAVRKNYEDQIENCQSKLRRAVGSPPASQHANARDRAELAAIKTDYAEQMAQLQQYQFVYHNPEDARALQREHFPDHPGVLFCR
jgi:outer membrane murein-binding lipoprotein Lpp